MKQEVPKATSRKMVHVFFHFHLPETNSEFIPKKWMLGILRSYWDGLFSGAFAVSFQGGYVPPFPDLFAGVILF